MGFAQTAAASMQLHDRLHNKLFIFVDRLTTKYHMIVYMGGSKCLQNTAMGHGHKLLTLLKISSLTKMSVNTHAYIYIWHQSLHLVSHPGLQSTPLDAQRDGNMSAASFSKNYDTRVEFWPIMFQNVTFPGKPYDPQDHVSFTCR